MKCTLRQLGYFVAASDHGSISAASKALNVSQPSVSVAISQIEKSYGVELFTRKNSVGINLTTAGQIVLREARMLLAHANDFDALATDVAQEVSGEIRIASFVNIAPIYMASIIRSFQKSHPDVLVKTFIGNQKEILEGIRSGHFEVAVSFDLGLSNEFRIDVGRSLPPKLVVHADHVVANRKAASLGDIIKEPFIYLDLPYSRDYFFSLFERSGLRPELTTPVASYETIRSYVGNRLGFSILNLVPRNATNYDGTKVRYISLKEDHRPLNICCVSLKRVVQRRAIIAFIDHFKNFFARLPKD
ncbi:MAG: LysR family transcriptional regulator [Alphaproteobacteria bacterium]|nr:LysR family transcriptional regulator [Alphaproteobacteria bacterium]